MSLNDSDVRKLANLARLELSDEEVSTLRPQLGQILEFVEKLSELDTEGVEPMTTALEVDNRWRDDEVTSGLTNRDAIGSAPECDGGYFVVPPVLSPPPTS